MALKPIQTWSCMVCPATYTFPRTLMGFKESLHHVLAKGLCISMDYSTIAAIGCPYFGHKTFRQMHLHLQTRKKKQKQETRDSKAVIQASLVDQPILWVGRLCLFYTLLKAGIVGPQANSLSGVGDVKWTPKWLKNIIPAGSETRVTNDGRKMVRKWHVTTKGTLKRSYRVPMKSEGRRLLKAIASLLSDDDSFRDATSHKGCQIRRESAHGESVCCNNVRALFDELPTPHLVVEITAFPAGPLTESDYVKAEKIERVLRTGASI